MLATDDFKDWLRKTPTKVLYETLIADFPSIGSWDEFFLAVEKIRKFQPATSQMHLTTTLKAAYFMFMSDDYNQYVTALKWSKNALLAAEEAFGPESDYVFWALNLISQICLSVEAQDGGGEIQSQNYALDLLQRQQTRILLDAFKDPEPEPPPLPGPRKPAVEEFDPNQYGGDFPVPKLPATIRVSSYDQEDYDLEFEADNWKHLLKIRDLDAETFCKGAKILIERMTPITPPEVFSGLAAVLQDLGRDDEAMAYLLRGVCDNPGSELLNAALGLAIAQGSTGDQVMRDDAVTLLRRAYAISRNRGSYSWDQLLTEIDTLSGLEISEAYPILSQTFLNAVAKLCESGLLENKTPDGVLRWAGNAVEDRCLRSDNLSDAAWGILAAVNKRFAPRRALTVAWNDAPEDVLAWTLDMLAPYEVSVALKKVQSDDPGVNDYFLTLNNKEYEVSLDNTTHVIQPINWGLEDCGLDLKFFQVRSDSDVSEFILASSGEMDFLEAEQLI